MGGGFGGDVKKADRRVGGIVGLFFSFVMQCGNRGSVARKRSLADEFIRVSCHALEGSVQRTKARVTSVDERLRLFC